MTTALSEPRLRRILLALDVAGPAPATLSFAVALAARFEAELEALLLTQAELTRAAALPFATEVSLLAGMERRLDARLMSRSLRVASARMRTMMDELAGTSRVRWSLRPAGPPGWEHLLSELLEGQLLVLGHDGRHASVPGGVCVIDDEGTAGHSARALALALDPQAVRIPAEVARKRLASRLATLRPQTLVVPAGFPAAGLAAVRPLLARLDCTLLVVG